MDLGVIHRFGDSEDRGTATRRVHTIRLPHKGLNHGHFHL